MACRLEPDGAGDVAGLVCGSQRRCQAEPEPEPEQSQSGVEAETEAEAEAAAEANGRLDSTREEEWHHHHHHQRRTRSGQHRPAASWFPCEDKRWQWLMTQHKATVRVYESFPSPSPCGTLIARTSRFGVRPTCSAPAPRASRGGTPRIRAAFLSLSNARPPLSPLLALSWLEERGGLGERRRQFTRATGGADGLRKGTHAPGSRVLGRSRREREKKKKTEMKKKKSPSEKRTPPVGAVALARAVTAAVSGQGWRVR